MENGHNSANRNEWTDAVTENPNTTPDPSAGQPPGGPADQAAEPARPGGSTDAAKAEPAPTRPTGPIEPTEPLSAARPTESAGPAAEPPATQNPATGGVAGSPWGASADQDAEHAEHAEHVEDTENAEYAGPGGPAGPDEPNTGVAATFLPGIDAASVLALVLAALGAGAFLLVNPLVQAHDAARTWSDFKNNVPRTKQDPFGLQRDWVNFQSWGHIILGLVAVLLALLVLALWSARKNNLRSRSFAQAALVLGLAVVLYGILLKTGAVGSEIPSMKEISTGLSSSSSQ